MRGKHAMKRLTSFFTLLVLMLGLSQSMNAQTWEFAILDANDAELMDKDANWYHSKESKKNRYSYTKALDKAAVTANGQEIAYTKGLLFSIDAVESGEGNLRAGNDTSNKRMWLAGKSKITIPGLKAGMQITVSCMSSSKTEARCINTTNITAVSGDFGTKKKGDGSASTNVGTVTEDGDVVLTMDGAMYIYMIKVEDPNEDVEGGNDGEGGETTPTTNDLSTSANSMKNQAVLKLKDGTNKYYNTESLQSIDFDDNKVKVVYDAQTAYTFEDQVAGIGFNKAEKQQSGEVVNIDGKVKITEYNGWLESAYVKFDLLDGASSYNVYYKGGDITTYKAIDNKLVRNYGTFGRADVVGLKAAADYAIKVVPVNANGTELVDNANEVTGLVVKSYSREGFAFMNGFTPGAYNYDGTLKSGAKVLYVTKNTAKTISTTVAGAEENPCVGIQAIIDAYQKGKDTTPIAFRLIGLIEKDDLDGISSSSEGIQIKGKNADALMPITIEGVGDDATVRGFGFLVRNSKGVEFRNFAVMRCMDDGISLDTDNSNIWVHHTDQFYGKHGSGDHAKGDGAVDVKSDSKFVTVSYNRFWDTGKSNMFGMKSESGPNYISYDHNWFDHSDSRHPRVRTMTVHVWNNYFDNVAKYGVGATTGSSVFVESNYFLKTKKPILSSLQGTDGMGSKGTFSGENGGMIKAYGNYMDKSAAHFSYYNQDKPSAKGYDAYEVTNRNTPIPETEKTLVGGTTYNNFDTDPSKMYKYTAVEAEDVPALITGYYGAGRMNHGDFKYTFKDNAGVDADDSAYDEILGGKLDSYKSSFVGFFGEDNSSQGGDQGNQGDHQGDDQGGEQGGETTPEGTIFAKFDGAPSVSMFKVTGEYGDGKSTYKDTYAKQGAKLNSKTTVTFTPAKNYNMTLVLSTSKTCHDVKLNGTLTTVSGKESTEGKYYEMQPIAISANTEYRITKGSSEGILMFIVLEPIE